MTSKCYSKGIATQAQFSGKETSSPGLLSSGMNMIKSSILMAAGAVNGMESLDQETDIYVSGTIRSVPVVGVFKFPLQFNNVVNYLYHIVSV